MCFGDVVLNTCCHFENEEHEHAFDHHVVEKNCFHARALDNLIELRPLVASIDESFKELRNCITSHYTSDMKKLINALEVMCPPWQPHKETILSHSETAEMLLNMPGKHVDSIGPIVAELMTQKQLIEATGFVEAATLVAADSVEKLGRETLVYGLVTRCMLRDWRKLKSPAEAEAAAKELRAAIGPKGVKLTAEMEAQLLEWESGAKIAALHAARLVAAARSPLRRQNSSSPVPARALTAASLAAASGSAPALLAASGSAPPSPVLFFDGPVPAPQQSIASRQPTASQPAFAAALPSAASGDRVLHPPERLSLAQRVAAAKRRKT